MALDPAANFVRGEVNGSVASGDTTFSVADASIFPDPSTEGDYNAVIWDAPSHPDPYQDPDVEIVRVTAVDTTNDDLTVTRGQESTSDVSHPSGSAIQMCPTAKMFTDIDSDKLDSANYTPEQDTHSRYADSEARSAIESGDLSSIDGVNSHRIRFDSDNSYVEITDHSNTRNNLVTQDTYIHETGTWLADHITNNSAHHGRYTDSEVRSVTASDADDLSDVTTHYQIKTPTSETTYTLFSVTNGPKVMLNVVMSGYAFRQPSSGEYYVVDLDVDGTTDTAYPSDNQHGGRDGNSDSAGILSGYPVQYDSSLQLDWRHNGSGEAVTAGAFVLGSGPHNAAIVQDGQPVYSVHQNLSDDQIEDLTPPSGYDVVKNPEITHPDPMTRGMWDDANSTVTDHPYWSRFHDALDNIRAVADQYGKREFLANVDVPEDRGTIPVTTPDWSQGNSDPDPSNTSHIKEDAVAFEKARWERELPDSI